MQENDSNTDISTSFEKRTSFDCFQIEPISKANISTLRQFFIDILIYVSLKANNKQASKQEKQSKYYRISDEIIDSTKITNKNKNKKNKILIC